MRTRVITLRSRWRPKIPSRTSGRCSVRAFRLQAQRSRRLIAAARSGRRTVGLGLVPPGKSHDQPPQYDRYQPAALEPVRSSQCEDEPGEQEENRARQGVACKAPHRCVGFRSQFCWPPHRPQPPTDPDRQRDPGDLGRSSPRSKPCRSSTNRRRYSTRRATRVQ